MPLTRKLSAAHHRVSTTLREMLAKLVKPYRPYKHYMRGPGPKCQQKGIVDDGQGSIRGSR
jgi:hypothetical protein